MTDLKCLDHALSSKGNHYTKSTTPFWCFYFLTSPEWQTLVKVYAWAPFQVLGSHIDFRESALILLMAHWKMTTRLLFFLFCLLLFTFQPGTSFMRIASSSKFSLNIRKFLAREWEQLKPIQMGHINQAIFRSLFPPLFNNSSNKMNGLFFIYRNTLSSSSHCPQQTMLDIICCLYQVVLPSFMKSVIFLACTQVSWWLELHRAAQPVLQLPGSANEMRSCDYWINLFDSRPLFEEWWP